MIRMLRYETTIFCKIFNSRVYRIFSPRQPAFLLSERQESFDYVCCRHAGSGVTIPCIRTFMVQLLQKTSGAF